MSPQQNQAHQHTQTRNARLLLLPLALLLLFLLGSAVVYRSFSVQQQKSTTAFLLSASSAQSSSGMAANYDSRPCAQSPSAATCNGVAPVTPQNVSPQQGVHTGSGACIDGASRILEEQTLQDGTGATIGTMQLNYQPTCKTYYAFLSLTTPIQKIARVSVWVQAERYGWYEKVSQLPPFPTQVEKTGPFEGTSITTQDFYTPLLYSATDPVSAHIDLVLADGTSNGAFTSSFTSGIVQYSGVA